MNNHLKPLIWSKPSGYAASHCSNCKYGWKRSNDEGSSLIICLLDREPIPAKLTDCDRHEARANEDQDLIA